MANSYYLYIMTNSWNTVLYTGVTNDPYRRVVEHRTNEKESFTKRYNITKVVYIEEFASAIEAITAEKRIKGWTRAKKKALINSVNPGWKDVLDEGDASLRSA